MQRKFVTTNTFRGYVNKRDQTNLETDGFLVAGSQNVVSTDGDTIASRKGYTLHGGAATENNPILGSYEWVTHRGDEIMVRSYDDELEFFDENTDLWVRVANSLTSARFNFAEFWDTTEDQDVLLGVNGSSNIFSWTGAQTTFASATINTITKQGVDTWGAKGFLTAGTRSVIIQGTTYAYTGGESTTTLTGVTPDPTVAAHTVGATAFQALRTTANSTITGLPTAFANSLIEVLNNQVWIGSLVDREVFVSKVSNLTDFSFSSPRLVGEGALLTFDQTPKAFIVDEDLMNVSCGKDFWYKNQLTLSSDNLKEILSIIRLKTSPQQGALSQSATGKIKNQIVFISNEPTLDSLGRVENIDTPQSKPLSDNIKIDFDTFTFTDAHIKYFKNNLYIAVPAESRLLILNLSKGFWEAPQVLPAGRLAIYGGDLFLHSNSSNETVKLFQGFSDFNSVGSVKTPINAIARFNYMNLGTRTARKSHTEWFSEGYISSNSSLTLDLFYDYTGVGGNVTKTISGTVPSNIIFQNQTDVSLGKEPLGEDKLGGAEGASVKNKFRVINEMPPLKYFEIQPQYSSNSTDQNWEVIAYGADFSVANDDNNDIKQ